MQASIVASPSPGSGGQGDVIGLQRQPDLEVDDGLSLETALVQIKRFAAGLRKRWEFVLSIIFGAVLIGVIVTLRATPIYQAAGTLKIEGGSTDVLNVQRADPNAYVDEERSVNTQIELIESRAFAQDVVKRLNLASDNSFFEKMHMEVMATAGTPEQSRAQREAAATGALQGSVSATPMKDTRIVVVSFRAPDPAIATKITNAYLGSAIASDEQRAFGTTKFARQFLENRLAQTKAKLETSERDAIAYPCAAPGRGASFSRSKSLTRRLTCMGKCGPITPCSGGKAPKTSSSPCACQPLSCSSPASGHSCLVRQRPRPW